MAEIRKTTITGLNDLDWQAWQQARAAGHTSAEVFRMGLAVATGRADLPTPPPTPDQPSPDPGRLAAVEHRLATLEGRLATVEHSALFGADQASTADPDHDDDDEHHLADLDRRYRERLTNRRDVILHQIPARPCIITLTEAARALEARTTTAAGWLNDLANHDLIRPITRLPTGLHRWFVPDPADLRTWDDDDIAAHDAAQLRNQLDHDRAAILQRYSHPGRDATVTVNEVRTSLRCSDSVARAKLTDMESAGMARKLDTPPGTAHQWTLNEA